MKEAFSLTDMLVQQYLCVPAITKYVYYVGYNQCTGESGIFMFIEVVYCPTVNTATALFIRGETDFTANIQKVAWPNMVLLKSTVFHIFLAINQLLVNAAGYE